MYDNELFRKNLIAARSASGLSAAELSRRANLNVRAVKDIEEGRSQSPKLATAIALAEALNVDPGLLMGIGARQDLSDRVVAYLRQFSEEEQERLVAAWAAIPAPSNQEK